MTKLDRIIEISLTGLAFLSVAVAMQVINQISIVIK